jgi:hypothetical protein
MDNDNHIKHVHVLFGAAKYHTEIYSGKYQNSSYFGTV